jgi:hypothetical protein
MIAADILILFFAGKDILHETPGFNHFFRMAESIVFLTFAILLLYDQEWIAGIIEIIIAFFYGYIFYVERKSFSFERISIQHLGIHVPGFPFDRFIPWIEINRIEADHQDFIIFLRYTGKKYHFSLPHHLKLEGNSLYFCLWHLYKQLHFSFIQMVKEIYLKMTPYMLLAGAVGMQAPFPTMTGFHYQTVVPCMNFPAGAGLALMWKQVK